MTQHPRRLPPTDEERLRTILHGAQSGLSSGQSRSLRATRANVPSRLATPPPAAGGGVLMQTAFSNVGGSSNDPIAWGTGLAGLYDIGPVTDYVDLTGGVLTLLQSCWLEVSVRADLSGVTAGQPVELYLALDGDPIGEIDRSPAKSSGVARASVLSGLYWFDFDNDDPTITAGLSADDSSGSFTSAVVKIVVVSGIAP